ncbi:MAG TPA: alpha/beta fold hydrolase [Pseudonocardiaceae bacterium]|nr:alpha/beta fold hydrolase [Pseudonocardiaceae bacterium]
MTDRSVNEGEIGMPYVETRAGRIHYVQRGAGPAVVLLHATLHDHRDFDRVADPLAAHYRTIALDWPGHGRSDPVDTASPTLFAGVLADVADRLGLDRAVLVGNSVGGFAAARFALDRPDLVAGLVLVNSGGFTSRSPLTLLACRVLGTPWLTRRLLPPLVPGYMKAHDDFDRDIGVRARARAGTVDGAHVAAGLWRGFASRDYDLRADGPRLRPPVLLVWGARDTILPLRAARRTRRAIPGATLHTLDTGHVVFASDPGGFLDVVEPFVAEAVARERSTP